MDSLTALIEAAALPVILTAGIGFCVWLVKGFLTKTAEHIKELLDRDRTSLSEKIGHIEKNLGEKIGNIDKLLDRDRASINEKFGHIDKQLSNHITETNKKIDKLAEGQAKLEKGQIKLEANLEAKLEKKIDSLFKLYLKSPDKKQ